MKKIIIIMVITGFFINISACSLGTALSAGKIVGETIYGATKKEPDNNQTKKRNTYYDPANPSD